MNIKKYIMPLAPVTSEILAKLHKYMQKYPVCFPVEETSLPVFTQKNLEVSYHEGDSDYIYSKDKMSHYPGRKLHKKKNLLKQFKLKYTFSEHVLSEKNKADARLVLDGWQSDVGLERGETDYKSCMEVIELAETLNLTGCICYVNNEPEGFLLGEYLINETFVIHFAKRRRKFKGLYQFMYSSFAKNLPETVKYLNFEQDLGKLTLKIAITSYQPDFMLKKYRLRLR